MSQLGGPALGSTSEDQGAPRACGVLGAVLGTPLFAPGLFTIFWTLTGRTYGDVVMGLRVLRRSGRALGLPGSSLRVAFCVVFPIEVLWTPVGRKNRSVQNAVLAPQVFYDWQLRNPRQWAQF